MINGYSKTKSDYDECKFVCENESACIGFAISNSTYDYPDLCYVHGNFSYADVDDWANPGAWSANPISTYGFKGFEVDSSSGYAGVQCYRRIYEENQNDGNLVKS